MADALALMKGNADGHGKGLTTYPDSLDEEQIKLHAECLALEADGKVARHADLEHENDNGGVRHVIWMPVGPS